MKLNDTVVEMPAGVNRFYIEMADDIYGKSVAFNCC